MHWKQLLGVVVAWGFAAGAASAGFPGASFATPLPHGPGTFLPAGGPLAAPVITPVGVKHGQNVFEMIPAGWEREPFLTRQPGRYLDSECDNPVTCSADRVGWLSLEFLYWATQGPTAPPLVTTGPPVVPGGVPAALGSPGTHPLFGGGRVLTDLRPGFRVEGGLWLDGAGRWALSSRLFVLGSAGEGFVGIGTGANVVNVPQFTPAFGGPAQFPVYVGFPGAAVGTATASAQTNFLGADTTLRRALRAGDVFRFDLLGGYRYLHLGDRLESFFDSATPGGRLMGEDGVRTRNNFHGANLGLATTGRIGRFTVAVESTVALGVTAAELDRSRTRAVVVGADGLGALAGLGGVVVPGAVPVVRTAAREETDYFAVVPEVGVKLGWHATDHLRLTAGYNVLYWSRVRRAQEQYALGPVLRNETTDFWAQGLGLGLELRY